MESQLVMLFAVVLAVLAMSCTAMPTVDSEQNTGLSANKRPKYMDTRELDIFKYMLLSSMRELVDDGEINPAVLTQPDEKPMGENVKAVAKRMQYMGICMRRRQNTFIPYPCLRSGRR